MNALWYFWSPAGKPVCYACGADVTNSEDMGCCPWCSNSEGKREKKVDKADKK